jgi:hypothetical protein
LKTKACAGQAFRLNSPAEIGVVPFAGVFLVLATLLLTMTRGEGTDEPRQVENPFWNEPRRQT